LAIYVTLYLLFTIGGLLLMKAGAGSASVQLDKTLLQLSLNVSLAAGLFCYAVSFLLWIVLLRKFDITYIVPLTTGISYVAVVVGGVWLFGERVSLLQGSGIAIILLGIVLLNIPK